MVAKANNSVQSYKTVQEIGTYPNEVHKKSIFPRFTVIQNFNGNSHRKGTQYSNHCDPFPRLVHAN